MGNTNNNVGNVGRYGEGVKITVLLTSKHVL